MLLVGLTGGLGSGKSTVAGMLASKGAVVLDADEFAREAVGAGTAGLEQVVARFGPAVLQPGGELDRAALACIVFSDERARRDLEAIVHPAVWQMIEQGIAANSGTDKVVVITSPLLVEMGMNEMCDVVVVLDLDKETQVGRAVERGMNEADARARIAAQGSRELRNEAADIIVDNDGAPEALRASVEGLWQDLSARATGSV
jgi:dephospho-CoA kinase